MPFRVFTRGNRFKKKPNFTKYHFSLKNNAKENEEKFHGHQI